MKKILIKREVERFLQDHNYIQSENMWWKKCGYIHIDFFDNEDQLCFYGHPAPVIEVTRTYLIVYDDQETFDNVEWGDEAVIGEIFRVQLDKIRWMKLTVKEEVEDESD